MARQRRHSTAGGVRVLVIGAGFAGLSALGTLSGSGARVTLVDQNSYSTFQPLLYQVATAGLNASDVAFPLWAAARKAGARFRRGELSAIDLPAHAVMLTDGTKLSYDYLILATGVAANYFGVPGAAEHTLSLYIRRDAVALRNRLVEELERRAADSGQELSIIVVGGGATGVELAGTLAELRTIALPAAFPGIDPATVHVRLIEQAPNLIAPFQAGLRDYALRQLRIRGVDVRLGTAISKVAADNVALADGASLHSDITVWTAGVAAPDAPAWPGFERGHGGRILTGPDLRIRGQERVFVAGDLGLIENDAIAQLAQPAIQQGRHAARQVLRLAAGQATEPFSYHDKGIMATIGHRSAVVQLPRLVRLRGYIAWLAWLGLHLVTLLGNRNRIAALVNLTWRYLTWSRGGGIIVGDDPTGG